ncbi:phosphatidate cytidylyltransferase ['Camptotheca acuminata' phytoplasma]|uniref:phosphatidate cytidylyltransferase n=1 Tax='Camptotheca acuminata' phytoplasma TaxID=3239192 RepID=UPI003519F8B3
MDKKVFSNKIYIGIILFFLNLFCFLIITKISPIFFIYFTFFFSLLIVLAGTFEILNAKKIFKKKIRFIYFFYVILNFCYFLSLLMSLFKKQNLFKDKYTNTLLYNFIFENFFLSIKNLPFMFLSSFFLLLILFLFLKDFHIKDLNLLLFILLYVVIGSACFFTLVFLNFKWFLYLFVITIASDSFSFLGGLLFGKHLLFPSVSPKKTWEGVFIGFIVSFVLVFSFYLENLNPTNIMFFVFFVILSGFISPIGDLIASKIKRDFGIKDFSNIIPGHGGFLDRFDSLLILSFFIFLMLLNPFFPWIQENIIKIIE